MNEAGFLSAAFAVFPEPMAVVIEGAAIPHLSNAAWAKTFADGARMLADSAVAGALKDVFSGQSKHVDVKFVGTDSDYSVQILPLDGSEPRAVLVHARPVLRAQIEQNAALLHRVLDCFARGRDCRG